jgi:hypothetical protein
MDPQIRQRGLIRHGKLLVGLSIIICQDLAHRDACGAVRSWNHLHRLFTSNFCATCVRPRVNWDLASVVQKKG